MKKVVYLLVIAVLACSVPVFAQGPFNDVPTDHWAYDAVSTLQKDGVLIGYPDGEFSGKRTLTRYEFATALARVAGMIPTEKGEKIDLTQYAKTSDLNKYALKSDLPDFSFRSCLRFPHRTFHCFLRIAFFGLRHCDDEWRR